MGYKNSNVVYKHHDKDGNILYIGCSQNISLRNAQHAFTSHWYRHVTNITVEHFEHKDDALLFELAEILKHRPPYNKLMRISSSKAGRLAKLGVSQEDLNELRCLHWRPSKREGVSTISE